MLERSLRAGRAECADFLCLFFPSYAFHGMEGTLFVSLSPLIALTHRGSTFLTKTVWTFFKLPTQCLTDSTSESYESQFCLDIPNRRGKRDPSGYQNKRYEMSHLFCCRCSQYGPGSNNPVRVVWGCLVTLSRPPVSRMGCVGMFVSRSSFRLSRPAIQTQT